MNHRISSTAFTIVELIIVTVVIAILATLTVVGIGQWREHVAETEVKSDLVNVQTGMEDFRNRTDGYPIFSEGTVFDGSNETKDIFTQSKYVTITYIRGNSDAYCLDVVSTEVQSVYMFLDTTGGNAEPQVGTCDGGVGAVPLSGDQTVFVFDTTAPGCGGTVQLPVSQPTAGGTIDWGDGQTQSRSGSLMTHAYSTPGKYVAKYTGPLNQASYYSSVTSAYAKCLTKVLQWANDISPTKVSFYRASNLTYVAEPPHTVTDMSHMFYLATTFNQPIGNWDTSNVTNMAGMLRSATAFNQPIGNWDTSNVTDMSYLLYLVQNFNHPIGNWDTSNVTNMAGMFTGIFNSKFNQPIGDWDTSKVTNMDSMFQSASVFNQPIGNWDTSNVTNMNSMFSSATAFNQKISDWDVSKVTVFSNSVYNSSGNWANNLSSMFAGATNFNNGQPCGDSSGALWGSVKPGPNLAAFFHQAECFNGGVNHWDTSNVIDMTGAFRRARRFNQPLSNWNTSNVVKMNYMFEGQSAYYSNVFNQNISSWDVSKVTASDLFRTYSALSDANTPPSLL